MKYAQTLYTCSLSLLHRNPDLVRRIGAATALEVRATGISYTFAPCLAVNTRCLSKKNRCLSEYLTICFSGKLDI